MLKERRRDRKISIYVERERWEGRKLGEDYESNGEEDNKY